MVHALEEAYRVLVPSGIMIDVRPLSVLMPLQVIHEGHIETAGDADMTPGLEYDNAVDQAIDNVLGQGIFIQSSQETFDYVYYWKTYHGMVVDFNERWQGEIIVSDEVLSQAKALYKQYYPHARLRLPMKMKLAKYVKKNN